MVYRILLLIGNEYHYNRLTSITLLSVFLPIDTFFRKMIVRGVERPIVAAKH
jgi:hypothetical protein